MKRILLMAAMLLASAFWASADTDPDYSRYYVTEVVSGYGLYCIRIDWEGKIYELEGDSNNEGVIKNYKENGNQRTFDVYPPARENSNKKIYSVVFTTDSKDTFTITLTTPSNTKSVYKLSTKDPHGMDDSSIEGKIGEKANAIKNAIGKGINKGIESMKQKKEAKKEAKNNGEEAKTK